MKCASCQTENGTGAKFCRGCGASLAMRMATIVLGAPEPGPDPEATHDPRPVRGERAPSRGGASAAFRTVAWVLGFVGVMGIAGGGYYAYQQAEVKRVAEEKAAAEAAKRAEEAKQAEDARKAEEARKVEEARQADEARKAEEERQAREKEEAAKRQAESARLAKEKAQVEAAQRAAAQAAQSAAAAEASRRAGEAQNRAAQAQQPQKPQQPSVAPALLSTPANTDRCKGLKGLQLVECKLRSLN